MRNLLKILAITTALLSSTASMAKEVVATDGFIVLPKTMRSELPNDEKTVRMYFDFYCAYCRGLHPNIEYWGSTLPRGFKVEYTPVVTELVAHQLLAQAYYYVADSGADAATVYRYTDNIYSHIHLAGEDPSSVARLIKESLADVGLSTELWIEKLDNNAYAERMLAQAASQSALNVNLTPMFILGGQYKTHLGFVRGEKDSFLTLLNGITSMLVYGGSSED